MKKNYLIFIGIFILLVGTILGNDFTPQGDINLRDTYNIENALAYDGVSATFDNNVTAFAFIGKIYSTLYNWIIGSTSSNYLSFNGTDLNFNETFLNGTIDSRATGISWGDAANGTLADNQTIGDYVRAQDIIYNTTMGTYVLAKNDSLAIWVLVVNDTQQAWADNKFLLNTGDTATGNYTFDSGTLFIDSSSNFIGINTTTPRNTLNILGDGNFTGNLTVNTYLGRGEFLTLEKIGSSQFESLQDLQNLFHSAGVFNSNTSVSFILLNADNTFNVTGGSGSIRALDDAISTLFFFDWASSNNIPIALDEVKYVGVEYNAGSPQVIIKSTNTWDSQSDFPLGSVIRDVTGVHLQREDHAVGDHATNMVNRVFATTPFARDNREGGLIIGTSGRNITVTAGTIWEKLNEFPIGAIDTDSTGGADTFDRYYRNGSGGWFAQTQVSKWNNTHYDDGSGTLALLGNNKWSIEWVYIEVDGEIVTLFGQEQFNSQGDASAASPPSTAPERIQIHSRIIGRIIFQRDATTAAATESVFVTQFTVAGVTDHGNLAGLNDDDHTQYLLADGTRSLSANWNQGAFNLTNVASWFLGIIDASSIVNDNWISWAEATNGTIGGAGGIAFTSSGLTSYNDTSGFELGIGTNSPDTLLHIKDGDYRIESTLPKIQFKETDGNINENFLLDLSGGSLRIRAANDAFSTSTIKMTIQQSGNVGIGPGVPDTTLHLHEGSSAENFLKITNTGTGDGATDGFIVGIGDDETAQIWLYENLDMLFGTNNVRRMTILAGGNVGIGTDNPQNPLNVLGDGNFTGVVYRNNKLLIDWSQAVNGTLAEMSDVLGFSYYNSTDFSISNYWETSNDLDTVISTDEITELKIDFNTVCGAGNHLYVSGNNLACEADDDTTYSAGGTLLDLTTTTFSINEGTLTDTKGCKYTVASGIVCDQDYLTSFTELDPKWSANYTAFLSHINWSEALNGTLFTRALWNTNYTANNVNWLLDTSASADCAGSNVLLGNGTCITYFKEGTGAGGIAFTSSGLTSYNDTSGFKLGIGTDNPSDPFNVVGIVNITSRLELGGELEFQGSQSIDVKNFAADTILKIYNSGGSDIAHVSIEGDVYTTNAGSDLWLGTTTQANSNFQAFADGSLNISDGKFNVDTSGDLFFGNVDADHSIYFYDGGSATGESLKWNNGLDRFEISNDLNINEGLSTILQIQAGAYISSASAIYTTGAGDDFWLGTSVQANALFRAYANGSLFLNDIVSVANITAGAFFVGDGSFLTNIPAGTEILWNANYSARTGTGNVVFATSPTFTTGITVPANSISDNELDEGASFDWTAAHTWALSGTFNDDLLFYDEIKPDGVLCSDGDILYKTAADDWDCKSISEAGALLSANEGNLNVNSSNWLDTSTHGTIQGFNTSEFTENTQGTLTTLLSWLVGIIQDESIASLVEDTTPQLGGYLDTNTQNIGSTSDEIENIYVGLNARIYFGDAQETSIYYNGTVLIIG